jgi:tetratricopeptide (TPR) repeat protein
LLGLLPCLVLASCGAPSASAPVTPAAPSPPPLARAPEAVEAREDAPAPARIVAASRRTGEPGGSSEAERSELEQLRRGDEAFDRGDLASARQHYEQARATAPSSPRSPVRLVRLRCAELGLSMAYAEAPQHPELEQMVSTLDGLLREHPEDGAAQLERGRLLLVLGDAERARSGLTRAVQLDSSQPEAHSALGLAYLASGHAQRALDELEIAARLAPDQAERLTNLGTAYMLRGRVSEAIASYERALLLAPNDPRTHGDLGAAHLANNRADRALPHLLRASELAPERATFITNLGYAYQQQGQLDKAVETQRRAIAIDPRLGSAWINLGNALAEQGHYDAARSALQRAETLDPTDPRPKSSLRDLAELEARKAKP